MLTASNSSLPLRVLDALGDAAVYGELPTSELAREAMAALPTFCACMQLPQPGEPYGRAILSRSSRFEVMLASWRADTACAPHDHGGGHGFVILLQGKFIETHFAWSADGLVPQQKFSWNPGQVIGVDEALIHAMETRSGGLSLHVYAPPAESMRVYDVRARQTLIVTGDCGAWIPESRFVRARNSWGLHGR